VQSAGTVRFAAADGGTALRVVLEYHPPGGFLGARLARFFGRDPAGQLDRDLTRLKELLENHAFSGAAG